MPANGSERPLSVADFVVRTALALGNTVLAFYSFWLVWRLLLPVLPGPENSDDRIAPFAEYFTDPFVLPLARLTRLPHRAITLLSLIAAAAVAVLLDDIGGRL